MGIHGYLTQLKIRKGDVKAFESLFRQYYAPLCQFAIKYVNDKDIAGELVQDFFYQYWKNKETMAMPRSLKAYMYISVRNNSLKYLRHQNIRQKYAAKLAENMREDSENTIQQTLETQDLQNKINEILNELPERCATIFRMSRYEGLKYKEIAEALSISIKTVEANMGKALQSLREKLDKYNNLDK